MFGVPTQLSMSTDIRGQYKHFEMASRVFVCPQWASVGLAWKPEKVVLASLFPHTIFVMIDLAVLLWCLWNSCSPKQKEKSI